MGTYQKNAFLVNETKYELKKLKEWIEDNKTASEPGAVQHAIFLEKKLEMLFSLYETK